MSYEKIVSQVEFAIRQEVRHLEVHNDLLDKCQTTEPNFAEISAIALCLHAFYNGVEGIFLSIAKEIDEFVPNSSSSHKELLNQIAKACNSVSNRLRFTLLCRILSELHEMFWRELVPSKFFVCLE